ncbi:MAG: hypothetical protein WBO29_10100, partial [Albidovulum sp.]
FKSPMWITPLPPLLSALGVGSHGSVLSENYAPYRLSSGCKSTITLSNGLAVQYQKKPSDIIYIGMGSIAGRLKSHFQGKLFDFMLGLSGANFDFRFAMPVWDGEADYYKHVEHLMLEDFQKTFGGLKGKKYPLMNKNAGSNKRTSEPGLWWRTPLKMTGKKVKWALSPVGGDFGTLD